MSLPFFVIRSIYDRLLDLQDHLEGTHRSACADDL